MTSTPLLAFLLFTPVFCTVTSEHPPSLHHSFLNSQLPGRSLYASFQGGTSPLWRQRPWWSHVARGSGNSGDSVREQQGKLLHFREGTGVTRQYRRRLLNKVEVTLTSGADLANRPTRWHGGERVAPAGEEPARSKGAAGEIRKSRSPSWWNRATSALRHYSKLPSSSRTPLLKATSDSLLPHSSQGHSKSVLYLGSDLAWAGFVALCRDPVRQAKGLASKLRLTGASGLAGSSGSAGSKDLRKRELVDEFAAYPPLPWEEAAVVYAGHSDSSHGAAAAAEEYPRDGAGEGAGEGVRESAGVGGREGASESASESAGEGGREGAGASSGASAGALEGANGGARVVVGEGLSSEGGEDDAYGDDSSERKDTQEAAGAKEEGMVQREGSGSHRNRGTGPGEGAGEASESGASPAEVDSGKGGGEQMPASFETDFLLSTEAGLGASMPSTIEDVKRLQQQLADRVAEHPVQFILAFSLLYICLQTFTLPGATVLNVLAGSLFGFIPGLLLITVLVTLGTLGSYTLSSLVLCELLQRWMPQRLERLRSEVAAQRHRLLSYLLFLRFNPVMPSWFINIASPVAGVPWQPFVVSSLLGFLPHTALAVNAGCVLSSINSLSDLYSTKVMVLLFLFSVVALIPSFVKSGNASALKSPRVTPVNV